MIYYEAVIFFFCFNLSGRLDVSVTLAFVAFRRQELPAEDSPNNEEGDCKSRHKDRSRVDRVEVQRSFETNQITNENPQKNEVQDYSCRNGLENLFVGHGRYPFYPINPEADYQNTYHKETDKRQ